MPSENCYFGQAGQMRMSWLPFADWGGWGFLAFGPDGQFGFSDIPHWIGQAFAKDQYGLPVFANLILLRCRHFPDRTCWFIASAGRCSFCWHCSA